MPSAQGWSKDRRRLEIRKILRHLDQAHGLSAAETNELLANRLGIGLNTIQGWRSDGETRDPPAWQVLDLLNYELELEPVRRLMPSRNRPRGRRQL